MYPFTLCTRVSINWISDNFADRKVFCYLVYTKFNVFGFSPQSLNPFSFKYGGPGLIVLTKIIHHAGVENFDINIIGTELHLKYITVLLVCGPMMHCGWPLLMHHHKGGQVL